MWRRSASLFVAFLLLWPQIMIAADRLYLPPAVPVQINLSEVSRIEDLLAARLTAYRIFDVLTEDAAKALIGQERRKSLLECDPGDECLKGLVRLLSSRYMVRTRAIGLSNEIIINSELLDARQGRLISKQEWRLPRPVTAENQAMIRALDRLVAPLKKRGTLLVQAEAIDSQLAIDNRDYSLDPQGKLELKLALGLHEITLDHVDYLPYRRTVFVPAGYSVFEADQISEAEVALAWYKKWWVWTLVGAVVTGVAGWLLLRPKQEAVAPPVPPFGTIEVRF